MSNQKRNKIYAISYSGALGFDSDSNILVTDSDYSVIPTQASFSSRLLVTDSNILVTDSDYSDADSGKF